MAKIPLNKERNALVNKTIQPNNWFVIEFLDMAKVTSTEYSTWMATDVSVQEPVNFQKVGFQVQGRPFSRPVLKENDGYEFTISMEETDDWKVAALINKFERNNIDEYGRHKPLNTCMIGRIAISTLKPSGMVIGGDFNKGLTWIMEDSFFVSADDTELSYNSPGKITRKLTFCCNQIIVEHK